MDLNLLLIRHAKSSWIDPSLLDFDRPLNTRGKKNAPLMGKRILNYNLNLDLIISSAAMRAKTTAKLIAQEINFDLESIKYESDLYHATKEVLFEVLSKQKKESIAIVGHNPGIQDFSNWLCLGPTVNFPTCGIVNITFNLDNWTEIYRNCGSITFFEYPKMFTSM